MKEQHKSATEGLTEEQITRAWERSERGRAMSVDVGQGGKVIVEYDKKGRAKWDDIPSVDWLYHHQCRGKLTSSERSAFDLAFVRARAVAGVRPAVDLALAAMRTKLMLRLGRGRWGAVG